MNDLYIYILKCEDDKYYVGKTCKISERIEDHLFGEGSSWTKRYKPITVEDIKINCDKYDEDKFVLIYMEKYGIDNVRGGTYSSIELSEIQKEYIQKQITAANDLCFKCGKGGHFFKECPTIKSYECYRCGRKGHFADKCFAKKHLKGYFIKK